MTHMLWTTLHDLLWPLRLALSVLVTLHVLRIKRDIGSAIGWIGLAWLAPLTGAILYAMFGINRVRRLARRLGRQAALVEPARCRGARADAPGRVPAAVGGGGAADRPEAARRQQRGALP